MKKTIVFVVVVLFSVCGYAQEKFFSEPLKIPLLVTGSFAELRPGHFHAGIDFRTEGKTGIPIYPAADGYISRIVVSPTGYGHALYINHSNNTTTVYGHLERFTDEIAEFVKNTQYKDKSFKVDINVPPGRFRATKNKVIAYSGNTGSSGGPHLHFEIRDLKSQEPINPVDFGFNIIDNTAPTILGLRVYPLSNNSQVNYSHENLGFKVVFYDGKYHLKNKLQIPVSGEIGFGIEVTDYIDGTWSKCGINYLKVEVDGTKEASFTLNRFSYSQTRFINSLIDYSYYIDKHKRYYKTFKDPGNKLPVYKFKNAFGKIKFTDNQAHNVEISVKDSHGNESVLEFSVKSVPEKIINKDESGYKKFFFNKANSFKSEGIKIECPLNAFYTNFKFEYNVVYSETDTTFYSDIHKVHNNKTPIHKPINISIKAKRLPHNLQDKALLALINEKTGNFIPMGGKYKNGFVNGRIRLFGSYVVAADTLPPAITPLSIKNFKELTEPNRIRFKISDNLSGIKNYQGYIDGKWVLFEYDAKNNLLVYKFDKARVEFNKTHEFKLSVSDYKGNTSVYEANFYK